MATRSQLDALGDSQAGVVCAWPDVQNGRHAAL